MRPLSIEGYNLLHEGSLTFAKMEANGMRIDTKYLAKTKRKLANKIRRINDRMKDSEEWEIWRKIYGTKANMGSREQLGRVLFEEMGIPCHSYTKTGRAKVTQLVLEDINVKFVRDFIRIETLKKTANTFLRGIEREVHNGFIHSVFNLHLTKTYRSSSNAPNSQNWPKRDPKIQKLIRRCFIPRKPGNHIIEPDFSGIEVKISNCYHKDPTMTTYNSDPRTDMHRDMASELYMVARDQVSKDVRYCAKNKFVFPEFYGDWYKSCAGSLWVAIDRMNLKTTEGVGIKEVLRDHGITKCGGCNPELDPKKGTFEYHVKEVEKNFWYHRFRVYSQWKKDWYENYLDKGYCDTLSGFRIQGVMDRKKIINYPIQGTAFHCLLWCLNRLMKKVEKYGMLTILMGQIHDSIIADVPAREVKDFVEMCQEIMTEELPKHWKWICVPIDIDIDISPKGKAWYYKMEDIP